MIHFLYLIGFGTFVSIMFAIFADGDLKAKLLYGLKIFAQFIGISLLLAWIFYFIP